MTVNYQEVRQEIIKIGKNAPKYEEALQSQREKAFDAFESNQNDLDVLKDTVSKALQYDRALRCAVPYQEALNVHNPLPTLDTKSVTLIAADGSQIELDRHAEVQFAMINIGAIMTNANSNVAPKTFSRSQLFYGDQLYLQDRIITDTSLALLRDVGERSFIADLAKDIPPPIISLTDGPLELWSARDSSGEDSSFKKKQVEYTEVLERMYSSGIIPAGYVDIPSANLIVRLLELTQIPEEKFAEIKSRHPLRGVTDIDIYAQILQPGERSAVFTLQSLSTKYFKDELQMHFFYLNVGRPGNAWLARIEIPAWVARDPQSLDCLHAVLIAQCNILGDRAYPYLLHRAHEIALVSLQEKEQVGQMVSQELRKQGIKIKGLSHKLYWKNLQGRKRYQK